MTERGKWVGLPVRHIRRLLVTQLLEDVGTVSLGQRGVAVGFGGDDGQAGSGVETGRRLPQLGQDQQSQQEGADDIYGDG